MGQESQRTWKPRDLKITAAVMIVVAILLMSGVVYYGLTGEEESEAALVYCTGKHVLSLDPACADDIGSKVPISSIYDTLVKYSNNGSACSFLGCLATRYGISPNGLWYNFTLRNGVRFSNGNIFSASDVKFSVERVLTMDSPSTDISRALSQSIDLNSTTVLDDYNLSIKLKHVYAGFLALIAQPYPLAILDRESTLEHYSAEDMYAHNYISENPVGTGPFVLKSWRKGSETVLVRNPYYWGGWAGNHIDKVVLKEVSEVNARIDALLLGKAQIADVPLANLSDVAGYPSIETKSFRTYEIEIAVMNTNHSMNSHSFMRNPNVRQALSSAFDYPNALSQIYQGHMEQIQGSIPNGIPFSAESQPNKNFSYSLEMASNILNASGYFLDVAGHRFNGTTMNIVVQPSDPLRTTAANSYADNLRKLGMLVKVGQGDTSILGNKGDWDLFFTNKAFRYPDPDDNVVHLLVSAANGGDSFITGIADQAIDAAARAGSISMSNSSRLAAYLSVWQESNLNPNMILIGQLDLVVPYNKIVENLQFDPVTGLDFYAIWRGA